MAQIRRLGTAEIESALVSHEIGPIAKPETITFVETLPKTRSGKIMRRILKARAPGQSAGDMTTLEE
jgi:acetyl-CoA synthetase